MPHLIFGKYITFFTSLIAVLVLYLVLSVPSRVQAAAAFGGSGSGSVFSCLPQSLVTSGARNVPFRSTCRAFFYSSHSRFLLFLHSSCLLITTARHRRKHSSAAPRSDSRLLLNAAPRRLLIYSSQAFSHTRLVLVLLFVRAHLLVGRDHNHNQLSIMRCPIFPPRRCSMFCSYLSAATRRRFCVLLSARRPAL